MAPLWVSLDASKLGSSGEFRQDREASCGRNQGGTEEGRDNSIPEDCVIGWSGDTTVQSVPVTRLKNTWHYGGLVSYAYGGKGYLQTPHPAHRMKFGEPQCIGMLGT